MVCFEFVHKNKKTYQSPIIDKRGNCEHTKRVKITPTEEEWISKKTGAKYPLSWKVKIPSKKIELKISPVVKKQEMLFSAINYWEGPFKVKGRIGKKKVKGDGFMELVGYPMMKSRMKRFEESVKKYVNKKIKEHRK